MQYDLLTGHPWEVLARAPANATGEALFLRGEAYRQLGMAEPARADLRAASHARDDWSGEANLSLGLMALDQDDKKSARIQFSQAQQQLKGEHLAQARFELADLDRAAGNLDQAAGRLGDMSEGYWAALGYLNLATDYARLDSDPSRSQVALRVAAAMVANAGDDDGPRSFRIVFT